VFIAFATSGSDSSPAGVGQKAAMWRPRLNRTLG
jgi:hypothetical protein